MSDSPFKTLSIWLTNNNFKSILDDEVIKSVSNISLLKMLLDLGELTVFFNNAYNNYDLGNIKFEEFARSVKIALSDCNKLNKNQFSYISSNKEDEIIKSLRNKLIHLKPYEIKELLEKIKVRDDYLQICDYLGINEDGSKIKKQKKTSKKGMKN